MIPINKDQIQLLIPEEPAHAILGFRTMRVGPDEVQLLPGSGNRRKIGIFREGYPPPNGPKGKSRLIIFAFGAETVQSKNRVPP
jgi:hypothetical protein